MTKYKDEYVIKLKRRVICWQECTYIVSHPNAKEAVKIAENENLYKNKTSEHGIIYQEFKIDENTIERLDQEKSWILSPGAGIGERPKGDPVSKIVFAIHRRTQKVQHTISSKFDINLTQEPLL